MVRFVENSRRGTCRQSRECGYPLRPIEAAGIFALPVEVPPPGASLFEVPLAVDLDPDVTRQETGGACLLELTHEAFESIIPLGLESPIFCFHDKTRILTSAGMILVLEQSPESEVGTVVLEEVVPVSSSGAGAPALAVSERVQALEKNVSRRSGRRGGRGGDPEGRVNALEQKVWTVCGHKLSRNSELWELALPLWKLDESIHRLLSTWMQLKDRIFWESLPGLRSKVLQLLGLAFLPGKVPGELRQLRLFEQWDADGASLYPCGYEGSACTDTYNDDGWLNQRSFWPSGRPRK